MHKYSLYILTLCLVFSVIFGICVSADISIIEDNKTIRIEYENYVTSNGVSVIELKGAGGGKVIKGYTKEVNKLLIPVSIPESGFYDIKYVVNKKTGTYTDSKINFSLNLESEFSLPFTNEKPEGKVIDNIESSSYTMCLYEHKSIWIDEDDYILETGMEKTGDGYFKYQLDYFELKPTKPPVILQSGVTKVEFEQFAGIGVYDWDRGITENATVSGGKVVFDSWSDIDPSFSFPVKVKESGFYHINYVVGDRYAQWFSKITYKLGKVTLGTNVGGYNESYGEIIWDSQPLCKYRKEWIWLDKGDYELKVIIEPDNINHVYKYQMDYIEFEPAVNGISMENGKIKVHAVYTDELYGKVLMAVYKGEKLVGTTSYNLSGESYIGLEYEPEDTVTNVKVFIWDSENKAKPKEMYKNFDL